jgi:capsular exopolysaccharide synthesis family protein
VPLLGEIPTLSKNESSWTFVDKDPLSIYAEAFRKLRTNIQISTKDHPIKAILVSSAAEGDGKSTVASNLAVTYSYLDKKVLLVDADFRRHRIHEVLGLTKEPGLTELLAGELELSNVIKHWKDNVYVITSGRYVNNATELLSSSNFQTTLEKIKENADLVVIDGPPFFLSETSSLSNVVDGLLLVAPLGSSKEIIRQMKAQIDIIKPPVLGFVANQVKPASYYGYYYAGYAKEDVPASIAQKSLITKLVGAFNGKSKVKRVPTNSNKRRRYPDVKMQQ